MFFVPGITEIPQRLYQEPHKPSLEDRLEKMRGEIASARPPFEEEKGLLEESGMVFLPVLQANEGEVSDPSAQVEVGFWPDSLLFMPGGWGKRTEEQLSMLEDASKRLREELPSACLVMLSKEAYMEADKRYREKCGQPLLSKFFTRTSSPEGAAVGRRSLGEDLMILNLDTVESDDFVGVAPGLVFVKD